MERIVKGIFIPIDIWEADDLSENEKVLLMEVDSFTAKGKPCYFSNEWIARRLKVSERSAARCMAHLIQQGLVEVVRFDGRHRFVESRLDKNGKADMTKMARQTCQNWQATDNISTDRVLSDDNTSRRDKRVRVFVAPTLEEVKAYCAERGNGLDAAAFLDHYESNGWMVGRAKMKDWRAAVRNWERKRRDYDGAAASGRPAPKGSEARKLEKIKEFYHDFGIDIPEL